MPLLPSHTLLQSYSITLLGTAYFLLTSPATIMSLGPLWLLGEAMNIKPARFTPSHLSTSSSSTTTGPGGIQLTRKSSFLSHSNDTSLTPATREILALLAFVLILAALSQSILATPLRYSATELTNLATRSVNKTRPKQHREDDTSAFAESLHTLHTSQTVFLSLAGLRVFLEGALTAYIYLAHSDKSSRQTVLPGGLDNVISNSNNDVRYGVFSLGLLANRITFSVAFADMLFWGYLYTVLREEAREIATILAKRRALLDEQQQDEDRS